jgi:hypothetical protein
MIEGSGRPKNTGILHAQLTGDLPLRLADEAFEILENLSLGAPLLLKIK